MANTASARKHVRQSAKARMRNRMRKSRIKTELKKLNQSIASGNKAECLTQQAQLQKLIDQAVSIGVYKKNTASRIKSRFMRQISTLS